MSLDLSLLEKRGGNHPRILTQEVEDYLGSLTFHTRLRKLKVGACIQLPFLLPERQARALQERIWRLNSEGTREFRTFKSKNTQAMFIFRLA